jgi:hypothetical protein
VSTALPQEFYVRRVLPDDVEYIMKTWGREVYAWQPYKIGVNKLRMNATPARLFYKDYQETVMIPLFRKAEGRVVCPRRDPSVIASFLVGEAYPEYHSAIVHFAYTRVEYRRAGLARAALCDLGYTPGDEVIATEWSRTLHHFSNPELIFHRGALLRALVTP